jgi:hypothetical protein
VLHSTAAINGIMKCSYIRNIKGFLNGNISEISEIIFYVKPKMIKSSRSNKNNSRWWGKDKLNVNAVWEMY